jgi:hypothetical protein
MVGPERRVVQVVTGYAPERAEADSSRERRSNRAEWSAQSPCNRGGKPAREWISKRHSGKEVKQIIAELIPVLGAWGERFPDGKCRPGVQQDGLVGGPELRSLATPAGGQRVPKRVPFSGDPLRDGFASVDGHSELPGAIHKRKIVVPPYPGKTAGPVGKGIETGWPQPVPR